MSPYWQERRWLWRTAIIALGFALLTGLISLILPRTYKAEARILPHAADSKSKISTLAAVSGFGDLLSGQLGGLENPVLTYPEILKSRRLLESVALSHFPGSPKLKPTRVITALRIATTDRKGIDEAIRALGEIASVDADLQSGFVSVSAVTRDSVLSAFIVQQMLDELNEFNLQSRASRERATREFVEARKQEAKRDLTEAEQALTAFRKTNVRIDNSPQLQLEQARLQREVDTQSQVYNMLVREYEVARIEEKRDTPTFSVVDPARPPVRKHSPRITLNVLVALIAATGVRVALASVRARAHST